MLTRSAVRSISFLWLASLAGAGCAFLTQVIIARNLGPESYGVFSATLAVVTLLSPLAGFGLQGLWLKTFGKEGWGAVRWLPSSFRFAVITTLSTLVVANLWSLFGPNDQTTDQTLRLLSWHVIGLAVVEMSSTKYLLEECHGKLALWQFAPHLARFVAVVFLVFATPALATTQSIATIYLLVSLTVLAAGRRILSDLRSGDIVLKGHIRCDMREDDGLAVIRLVDVAKEVWPFGLGGALYLVYFQSNVVLLKYLAGDDVAGVYNVAFTIMAAVYLLPNVVYQKLMLPRFHRWVNHDPLLFRKVYAKGNAAMLALGLSATILLWVIGPWGLRLVFGHEYAAAIPLVLTLAVGAPLRFVATSVGATLVTLEHMRRKVRYMGLVAVVNVSANLVLIPHQGALGAAIATLISDTLLLFLYVRAAQRYVFQQGARSVAGN